MSALPTDGSRRVLLVTGMHHAGVSAVARLLGCLCGETVDEGAGLARAAARINEDFLSSIGSWCCDAAPLPEDWSSSPEAAHARERIRRHLATRLTVDRPTVVVDPRICRLAPLWRQALRDAEAEPHFVLVVPRPAEVAAVMQARDGLAVEESTLRWLWHVLPAERSTRRAPRALVLTERLGNDGGRAAASLAAELSLSPRAGIDEALAEMAPLLPADAPLGLQVPAAVATSRTVAWGQGAYEALAAGGCAEDEPRRLLDEIHRSLETAGRVYTPVVKSGQERLRSLIERSENLQREVETQRSWAGDLKAQLGAKVAKLRDLQEEFEDRTRWARKLDQGVRERDARLTELESELEERTRWARDLDRRVGERTRRLQELEEELEEKSRWVRKLDQRVRERDARLVALGDELEERTGWGRDLDRTLGERDARLAELEGELEERTRWARDLDRTLGERDARLAELGGELEERTRWARDLDRTVGEREVRLAELGGELEERTRWARDLDRRLGEREARMLELQNELEEKNRWARGLGQEIETLRGELYRMVRRDEELEAFAAETAKLAARLRAAENRLAQIYDSKPWQLYRRLALLGRRLRSVLMRIVPRRGRPSTGSDGAASSDWEPDLELRR